MRDSGEEKASDLYSEENPKRINTLLVGIRQLNVNKRV